jgi:hypothetical protein
LNRQDAKIKNIIKTNSYIEGAAPATGGVNAKKNGRDLAPVLLEPVPFVP